MTVHTPGSNPAFCASCGRPWPCPDARQDDNEQPRIGSLCSGYGGLDGGLQAVIGGTVAWHAENDPDPAAILAHHWPDVPNLRDITTVEWATVEPVDWLTAGYPCQPFSLAGQRKGTDDERHLWPYVAAAIGVLRPRRVLLENVAGHVTLGLGTVLGDLAALGYDATWGVVRAADAGAPHRRERLFILARDANGVAWSTGRTLNGRRTAVDQPRAIERAVGSDRPLVPHPDGDALREQPVTLTGRGGPAIAGPARADAPPHPDGDGLQSLGGIHTDRRDPHRRGGPDADGNDGEPSAPPADPDDARPHREADDPRSREPDLAGRDGGGQPEGRRMAPVEWGPYGPAIARWEHTIGRAAPRPTELGRHDRPRLSPAFVEWLMGLPAGHVTAVPGLTRAAQLKALGNGVVPQQAALAVRVLLNLHEPRKATA